MNACIPFLPVQLVTQAGAAKPNWVANQPSKQPTKISSNSYFLVITIINFTNFPALKSTSFSSMVVTLLHEDSIF